MEPLYAPPAQPGRPAWTHYDDRTGERVELSHTTLDNWVAKTANLLRDDVGLVPGDAIAIRLPTHWQTPVTVLAAWLAGLEVHPLPSDDGLAAATLARVTPLALVVDALSLDALLPHARGADVLVHPLAPMNARLALPRSDVTDVAAAVLVHGDVFSPEPGAVELAGIAGRASAGDAIADARAQADAFGLTAQDRVLLVPCGDGVAETMAVALPALVVGAGVVATRYAEPDGAARRADAEGITVACGPAEWLAAAALDVRITVALDDPDAVARLRPTCWTDEENR